VLCCFVQSEIQVFSLQGVGGTVQYPKGYLKKAYEIVRENGGLYISDEVILKQLSLIS